jgi:molecular chaperone GrpE
MKFNRPDKEEEFESAGTDDAVAGDPFEEKIAAVEQTLVDTRDQLLRRTAELENMRRRHQAEREQLIFEANKRLILDLLEVVDDLERTLQHASEEKDPIAQGIELVYKNFLKTLERYGVRPMLTVGEPFDPMKHDALMEEPRTDVPTGTVTREIQRGYLLRDAILRHAKVFVAKEQEPS